jgi:hypothetical protein
MKHYNRTSDVPFAVLIALAALSCLAAFIAYAIAGRPSFELFSG